MKRRRRNGLRARYGRARSRNWEIQMLVSPNFHAGVEWPEEWKPGTSWVYGRSKETAIEQARASFKRSGWKVGSLVSAKEIR